MTLFWELFGHPGEDFGDLGGSWEQVGILMYFRRHLGGIMGHLGAPQIQRTCPGEGKMLIRGA